MTRYLLLFTLAVSFASGQIITTPLNTPAPGTARQCNQNDPHEATCVGCWRLGIEHICYNYPKLKKHKPAVKHSQGMIDDSRRDGDAPGTMRSTTGWVPHDIDPKELQYGWLVNDGVAAWQAPKKPEDCPCPTGADQGPCCPLYVEPKPEIERTPDENHFESGGSTFISLGCIEGFHETRTIIVDDLGRHVHKCEKDVEPKPEAAPEKVICNKDVEKGWKNCWQCADYKPDGTCAVPETIKDTSLCDQLPETQRLSCQMNMLAPEKAGDGSGPIIIAKPNQAAVCDAKADECTAPLPEIKQLNFSPIGVPKYCGSGHPPNKDADCIPVGHCMPGEHAPEVQYAPDGTGAWWVCEKDTAATLIPDPIKTAQEGYDCTMTKTEKTLTISCTKKDDRP